METPQFFNLLNHRIDERIHPYLYIAYPLSSWLRMLLDLMSLKWPTQHMGWRLRGSVRGPEAAAAAAAAVEGHRLEH